MDSGDFEDFNFAKAILFGFLGIAAIVLMILIMGRMIELKTSAHYERISSGTGAEAALYSGDNPERENDATAGTVLSQNSGAVSQKNSSQNPGVASPQNPSQNSDSASLQNPSQNPGAIFHFNGTRQGFYFPIFSY